MDLYRYARYLLADQFQVNEVQPGLLCLMGPFCFGDGQFIEVYAREDNEGIELVYYSGLAEILTLEAIQRQRDDSGRGAEIFKSKGLELHPDRLGTRTDRERLLEDLIEFNDALRELDRRTREASIGI